MDITNKARYDYILIWGHGLIHKKHILDSIRKHNNFKIIKIIDHKPKSIKQLINRIYSYDYAPIEHLKSKTKYLEQTPNEVLFIFIKNNNPQDDFFGTNSYRHSESNTLKDLKEHIRNKYNPYFNGVRTENHVIHASDNESQTNDILKYLGYNKGVNIFNTSNNLIKVPYFTTLSNTFEIKKLYIDHIYCNILQGNKNTFYLKQQPIQKTPHYLGISNDIKIYNQYIDNFLGGPITSDHDGEKYLKLSKDFKYLTPPYHTKYIVIKQINSKLVIMDGVHRAAILKHQNKKQIICVLIK